MTPHRLGPAIDVHEGTARGYPHAGVFVVRREGRLHVWRDACPHDGLDESKPLAWKRDVYLDAAAEYIVCGSHGALFEIDTGLCILGPCRGQRLAAVPWRIDDDGDLELAASVSETSR